MLKIEIIAMPYGTKVVVEAEDASSDCLKGIEQKIRDLSLRDGEIVFVEFLTLNNPSVAVIIAGIMLEHFHTIAVTERGWDCFVIAAVRPDSPFALGTII